MPVLPLSAAASPQGTSRTRPAVPHRRRQGRRLHRSTADLLATGTVAGVEVGFGVLALLLRAESLDVVATAVWAGLTAEELAGSDLSYAPPFSPVWDPVLIAVRKLSEQVERSLADCR